MKTQIFKSYADFLKREDKEINGVDSEFANAHPNYEKENETNKRCFNCSNCSNCSRCSDCSDCYDCSNCSDCSDCYGVKNENNNAIYPIIENIHHKLLQAVTATKTALDMSTWHTCGTTHCRAGWIVKLAGEEGQKLEKETSTLFAAMMIYKASSPLRLSPARFFDSDKEAMEDIKRCAEEESKLNH